MVEAIFEMWSFVLYCTICSFIAFSTISLPPRTYLINGQFIGIPLCDALDAQINNSHLDVWTFQGDYTARWSTNIASANAANLRNHHASTV